MPHAFTAFLREQTDRRGWAQADVVNASGLSRALVSKWLTDDRDHLTRLPDRDTVTAFARAFNVSPEFMLGKAVEATGMGYTAGDFVNTISTASNDDLVDELHRRLTGSYRRSTPVAENQDVDAFTLAARRSGLPRAGDLAAGPQDDAETGSQERPDGDS